MSRLRPLIHGCLALGLGLALLPARAHEPGTPVQPSTARELRQALERRRGEVVLVNVWATWCGPCRAEFPDLVRLHQEFRERSVAVIAVSLDEPEDRRPVETFIRDMGAEFPVFVRASGGRDAFLRAVHRRLPTVVPTTYVFDGEGRLVGRPLEGRKSYAELARRVEEALAR